MGYNQWGRKESDMTEQVMHTSRLIARGFQILFYKDNKLCHEDVWEWGGSRWRDCFRFGCEERSEKKYLS